MACNFIEKRLQLFSCEFCEIFKNIYLLEAWDQLLLSFTEIESLKHCQTFLAITCTGCGFENNCLEAWNFHKWILVRVLSSTAESSIWRCSEISCSKIFRTPRKHPWWSLFSQVGSLKFEHYVKVDSFIDVFVEIYRNLYIE